MSAKRSSIGGLKSPLPPKMNLVEYEENESTRPPLRLQITPDESDENVQEIQKPIVVTNPLSLVSARVQSVTRSVVAVGLHEHKLTEAQALSIATTLFLAQQIANSENRKCYLVLGDNIQMPANLLGLVSRTKRSIVPVRPDLSTLAATRFDKDAPDSFTLTCRFVVGEPGLAGVAAATQRFPVVPLRQNAISLPWAAFNPAIHSEMIDSTKRLVVFENTLNRVLHGDSILMRATRNSKLGLVDSVANDQVDPEYALAVKTPFFYRDSFPELTEIDNKSANMYGVKWHGDTTFDTTVNIDINYGERMTVSRAKAAVYALKDSVMSKQHIDALMRAVIVEKRFIV